MIIYTSIVGPYDELPETPNVEGVEFVAFTDVNFKNPGKWILKPLRENRIKDNRRESRWYKFHPHKLFPEARYTLWIDANRVLKTNPHDLKNYIGPNGFAVRKHPKRKCLFEEAETVKKLKMDSEQRVDAQTKKYSEEGMPRNYGLYSNNIILRDNTDEAVLWSEAVWDEYKENSCRDQIAAPYVCWSYGLKPGFMPSKIEFIRPHKK